MDQLDEESFLDELMSLHREEAPAPALWQAYPGSAMMTMSDLLFYGGEAAADARSGMGLAGPFQQPMAPLPAAPPHRSHEEFNFDCLSEVCNSYRSCVGVIPENEVVDAAGQALVQYPLHGAMAEDNSCGGKLHHDGGGSPSPPFVFGGRAVESSEMRSMLGGVVSGAHHRNNKLSGGAPSKNLMAERRRRKRLNDRLSMLRSIVPKISKMDRTAILGDTIDYVKELRERIRTLEEEIGATPEELNLLGATKSSSSGSTEEMLMRNSTQFVIEKQGDGETRIEICCATSPGVLISTVGALEVLGLEIEECVISCFSDFAMQASCSQLSGREEPSEKHIRDQAGIVQECRLWGKVSVRTIASIR